MARQWRLIDCAGRPVGRLATEISLVLRGKDRPIYTPSQDTGDFVVAVNAGRLRLTGTKPENKRYWRHSGYPGGISSRTAKDLLANRPEVVLREAVRRMLPKNILSRRLLRKLKIYAGSVHPHAAQQVRGTDG